MPDMTEKANNTGAPAFNAERAQIHRAMLSPIAHDLKSPLSSMIGSLEVLTALREKLPPEKQNELIRVALQEAYRLDGFISNVLDMAKLESGLIVPKEEEIDLGGLIGETLARMQNRLQNAGIEVLGPPERIELVTDPVLLSQVLGLVLDNAVKYGGSPPEVRIEFGRDDTAYIRIFDNGSGLDEDKLEAVFSKYARFNGGLKTPGAGLGLAIAREIMRLLKGRISAASHSGGAAFILRLPVR